ncbi:MAG TPA: response regulator [Thermoanaerobaculia bacterium]|nr:response regulator [Thermoanaerobaculia bacterium]
MSKVAAIRLVEPSNDAAEPGTILMIAPAGRRAVLSQLLEEACPEDRLLPADNVAAAQAWLETSDVSLVLLDVSTFDATSPELFEVVLRIGARAPLVLLADPATERLALAAARRRAVDCLRWDELDQPLLRRVRAYVGSTWRAARAREYQESLEATRLLASGISHRLRNLLTIVIGESELMLEGGVGGPVREYVEHMRDLAVTARECSIDLDGLVYNPEHPEGPSDLNDLVSGLRPMLEGMTTGSGSLRLELDASGCQVQAEASALRRAVLYLVHCATASMRRGGGVRIATGSLDVRDPQEEEKSLRTRGRYGVVTVEYDHDPSQPVDVDRLMQPFSVDGSHSGLREAFAIAKKWGGNLRVAEGEDGRIRFELSFRRIVERGSVELELGIGREPVAGGGDAVRVLVVEDDPAILSITKSMLERCGLEVTTAENGLRALDQIGKRSFDLMLSDVCMPMILASELATRVEARAPGTRCLFVSGFSEENEEVQSLISSGYGFIRKPYSMSDLRDRVREVLGLRWNPETSRLERVEPEPSVWRGEPASAMAAAGAMVAHGG